MASEASTVFYFTYGSNLVWTQMCNRCPSARFLCAAKLTDHRLAFTGKSIARNCGVADVIDGLGSDVWGVVYQIDEADLGPLDHSEGYSPGRRRNAYKREKRRVLADGDSKSPLTVWIYFAYTLRNPPLPSEAYKKLIVDGPDSGTFPRNTFAGLKELRFNRDPQGMQAISGSRLSRRRC